MTTWPVPDATYEIRTKKEKFTILWSNFEVECGNWGIRIKNTADHFTQNILIQKRSFRQFWLWNFPQRKEEARKQCSKFYISLCNRNCLDPASSFRNHVLIFHFPDSNNSPWLLQLNVHQCLVVDLQPVEREWFKLTFHICIRTYPFRKKNEADKSVFESKLEDLKGGFLYPRCMEVWLLLCRAGRVSSGSSRQERWTDLGEKAV